jgi:phosphoglycerol geranylgeranyltransferase
MNRSIWEGLAEVVREKGAGYFILLDPDRHPHAELRERARRLGNGAADALLVGTSLNLCPDFGKRVGIIKQESKVPVILFPAHAGQLTPEADAVLFLSLLSGRNPQYLVGEHVRGAPLIKAYGLESIPVAYLLVESGSTTAVEFVSNTRPLPRDKPEIAVAHALAAEYLGMKMVYLEAGSGGEKPVPEEMVRSVAHAVNIPVMVGGGITTPAAAGRTVAAGASFVVTGNVLERSSSDDLVESFARAIHRDDVRESQSAAAGGMERGPVTEGEETK